jgi:hypothetical protein
VPPIGVRAEVRQGSKKAVHPGSGGRAPRQWRKDAGPDGTGPMASGTGANMATAASPTAGVARPPPHRHAGSPRPRAIIFRPCLIHPVVTCGSAPRGSVSAARSPWM